MQTLWSSIVAMQDEGPARESGVIMYGVDFRYYGDAEYRTLDQRFDTYIEAEMASADLAQLASVEEVVVTSSNPFEVER